MATIDFLGPNLGIPSAATQRKVWLAPSEHKDQVRMEVPPGFICPISHEILKDPVMDPEGNTYERARIVEWLGRHQRSPLTNSPLSSSQLIPNRALKDSIAAYLEDNPQSDEMHLVQGGAQSAPKSGRPAKAQKGSSDASRVGSFAGCAAESPPWMHFDVRGDKGTEVRDYKKLAAGTQVSFDCVFASAIAATYRHHGVYIGMLTEELWKQLEDPDPALFNKHCVIHLQRDENRPSMGSVEIQTVEDFTGGRPLFSHRSRSSTDNKATLKRAIGKLDQQFRYSHKKFNCEHFATWCTQGVASSPQGDKAEEIESTTWASLAVAAVSLLGAAAMVLSSSSSGSDKRERRR